MPAPKGKTDPVAVLAEIERGERRPVYLVHGSEEFLVERAAARIVKGLAAGGDDRAEVVRIADETVDWSALTARLRTPSLFEPRLVFFAARVELFAGKKKGAGVDEEEEGGEGGGEAAAPAGEAAALLQAAVEEGFGTAHSLVLTAVQVDRRRTLYKAIRKAGRVLEFSPARWEQARTATAMLQEKLEQAGKRISGEALKKLLTRVGTDLRRLTAEADKLILYAGDRAAIGPEDVDAVVACGREEKVFELTDAVGRGDAAAAAGILRQLQLQGESYMMILGFLRKQFERLLQACDILDGDLGRRWSGSMTYPEFQRRFLPALREKVEAGELPPNGQHPYALFMTLQHAGRFTVPAVEDLLRGALRVQKKIFSGAGSPPLLIEDLLHRACKNRMGEV